MLSLVCRRAVERQLTSEISRQQSEHPLKTAPQVALCGVAVLIPRELRLPGVASPAKRYWDRRLGGPS